MKRFNISVGIKILIIAITVLFAEWLFEDDNYYASTFCAYGKVFVKFKEGNSTWGTLMLDNDGRPIKCNEDKLNTNKAQVII